MDIDKIVLNYDIEQEKAGKEYVIDEYDREVLNAMLKDINKLLGTDYKYLAELNQYIIRGSGEIVAEYIKRFNEETTRAYLLDQFVYDHVENCDKLLYELYLHFKASDLYITRRPGAAGFIAVCYDNAFWRLKSRKIKNELFALTESHRDAANLPLTMRVLASWRLKGMEERLQSYLDENTVTPESMGLYEGVEGYYPRFSGMKRQLKFDGIGGLKYYYSPKTLDLLRACSEEKDKDISSAAMGTLKYIKKRHPDIGIGQA